MKPFGPWKSIYVVHNNHFDRSFILSLPEGEWKLVVDPENIFLDQPKGINNKVKIGSFLGTYVFCEN